MVFLKFTDKSKLVEAQVKKLNKNQIEVIGCAINTSGFVLYNDAEMRRKLGDYYDFTTLYRELDESYILSNNGSVYPTPPEQEEPTLREMVDTLNTELSSTQKALDEANEQNRALTNEVTNLQEAVAEVYELLLTNDNGGDAE